MYDRHSKPSRVLIASVTIVLHLTVGAVLNNAQANNRIQTAPIILGYSAIVSYALVTAPLVRHERISDWKHKFSDGAVSEPISVSPLLVNQQSLRKASGFLPQPNYHDDLNDRSPPDASYAC
jgi:hypothetical protein